MRVSRAHLLLVTGVAGAAAVLATVNGISNANASEVRLAKAPRPAATIVNDVARTSGKAVDGRLGAIISTGMDASKVTEWVIYGVPVKDEHAPSTTFGFELSERRYNGTLTKDLDIAEVDRPELASGFHAVEGAYSLDGGIEQPAFGYFVGNPAKITGQVAGKSVTAHKVAWSENASVTVFWFDNEKVTGATTLSAVSAFDAAGNLIAKAPVSHE